MIDQQPRAGYAALALALALGVLGDSWLRGGRLGVGAVLYAALLVAALAAVRWLAGMRVTRRNLWCIPVLLLAALVPALRDESVLVFASLVLLSGLLVLLAHGWSCAPIDRWRAASYVGALVSVVGSMVWRAASPLRLLASALQRRLPGHRYGAPVLRGLLFATPALLAFTLLLASADVVFSAYLEKVTRLDLRLDFGWLLNHSLLVSLIAWLVAGGLLHTPAQAQAASTDGVRAPADDPRAARSVIRTSIAVGEAVTTKLASLPSPATSKAYAAATSELAPPAESSTAAAAVGDEPRPRVGFIEAVTGLASIDALFVAFVLVQATYLFGGRDTLDFAAITYRDYARRGFFELLAVAALVLPLIVGLDVITPRASVRQRLAFLALAATLLLCTLVILASAMTRLLLFEDTFGWTPLRLHGQAFMVWLAALCLLVLGTLFVQQRRWLVFGTVLSVMVVLLGFALLDPDRFIAEQNLSRYANDRPLDVSHFTLLSHDATPVLLRAFDLGTERGDAAVREALGQSLRGRLADLDCAANEPWYARNLARTTAHAALDARRAEIEVFAFPYAWRWHSCAATTSAVQFAR